MTTSRNLSIPVHVALSNKLLLKSFKSIFNTFTRFARSRNYIITLANLLGDRFYNTSMFVYTFTKITMEIM